MSEQLPPEINERRNHLMSSFIEAKSTNKKPKWNVDKLVVSGTTFSKPKDETDFANSVPITISPESIKHTNIHTESGSSFQAHITQIDDSSQAVPVLHQVFSNHAVAKATHNMYAYRIQGKGQVVENSCDDGEYGAGKRLLKLLRDQNIINKIVIVTRWYGGKHMGPRRFDCITEVANKALQALSSG